MTSLLIPCEAGCHVLGALVDQDHGLVCLSFYVGNFYSGQESLLSRWKRRLGIAVTVLRGCDYQFDDIVLSKTNARLLAEKLLGGCPDCIDEPCEDHVRL